MQTNLAIVSVLSLFLFASDAKSSVISYGGYTLNEQANIVSDGTLDWLQWDMTLGMTINEALSTTAVTYLGGGWTLASNEQMVNLINAFDFRITYVADERIFQESQNYSVISQYEPLEDINVDPAKQMVALFGQTSSNSVGYNDLGYIEQTVALFGSDANNNGKYNQVTVQDDVISEHWTGNIKTTGGETTITADIRDGTNYSKEIYGVALVRASNFVVSQPTNELPINNTGILFALSIGLVSLLRRIKLRSDLLITK